MLSCKFRETFRETFFTEHLCLGDCSCHYDCDDIKYQFNALPWCLKNLGEHPSAP